MPFAPTSAAEDPTNADAEPVLDGWGWADYWDVYDWMKWHTAMVQKYGVQQANQVFISYWNEQGFGAGPIDERSFNETFRDYARANGFLDDLYSGASVIATPLGWVTDIFSGATQLSGHLPRALSAVGQIASTVSFLWPVILGGVAIIYATQAKESAKRLFKS